MKGRLNKSNLVEWHDVQGLVLGFGHLKFSQTNLYRISSEPAVAQTKEWLASQAFTSAARSESAAQTATNVAFGFAGLMKLGVEGRVSAQFSDTFQLGMSFLPTMRALGDVYQGAPNQWRWSDSDVHLVVSVFAAEEDGLLTALDELAEQLDELELVDAIRTYLKERGHFGFVDGISNPQLPGRGDGIDLIAPGEVLLGYPDSDNQIKPIPAVSRHSDREGRLPFAGFVAGNQPVVSFGRNGSYLVIRQIEQHVETFDEYLRLESSRHSGLDTGELAAKLVGRTVDGNPLTPLTDNSQLQFSSLDTQGQHCPLGAHIRRANPRDVLTDDPEQSISVTAQHRLLRRGRMYGPKSVADESIGSSASNERGLLFACLNASIADQFEHVQSRWLQRNDSTGLRNEADPLVGTHPGPQTNDGNTIVHTPVPYRTSPLPRFTTVHGGGYFFLPSLAAIRYIAALDPARN